MAFSFLRGWLNKTSKSTPRGRQGPGPRRRYRPILEPLEGRWVAATFTNPAAITINASPPFPTRASPYPSAIEVSGLAGTVTKVTVTLHGYSHGFPSDVDVLLVAPNGANAFIMSDVGGSTDAINLTLTLDDAAAAQLETPLTSGTFRPTNAINPGSDTFPAPAPDPSAGSALAIFNGLNPNGAWRLFVVNDGYGAETGSIAGGWTLDVQTEVKTATDVTAQTSVDLGRARLGPINPLGLRKARRTVTITNTSGELLYGPITLLLTGLKKQVRLKHPEGRSVVFAPGRAFVTLAAGADNVLNPGESVTFTLTFKVPAGRKVRFAPRVICGVGPR